MVSITGNLALNPINGRVVANINIAKPLTNLTGVYLLTKQGKQIDALSAEGQASGVQWFTHQNIHISNTGDKVTIDHIYTDLENVKPSDVYIKIDVYTATIIPFMLGSLVATKYMTAIGLCSASSFRGSGIKTYYSNKAPYSNALKELQAQTGGTYSLNVDYRDVQQVVPTTDKYVRPDGKSASCTKCQLQDFKNNYMWSRVTVDSTCHETASGNRTFWIRYRATLNTLTQPKKGNTKTCLIKSPLGGCLMHEPSMEDIIIGGAGILILVKVVFKLL